MHDSLHAFYSTSFIHKAIPENQSKNFCWPFEYNACWYGRQLIRSRIANSRQSEFQQHYRTVDCLTKHALCSHPRKNLIAACSLQSCVSRKAKSCHEHYHSVRVSTPISSRVTWSSLCCVQLALYVISLYSDSSTRGNHKHRLFQTFVFYHFIARIADFVRLFPRKQNSQQITSIVWNVK